MLCERGGPKSRRALNETAVIATRFPESLNAAWAFLFSLFTVKAYMLNTATQSRYAPVCLRLLLPNGVPSRAGCGGPVAYGRILTQQPSPIFRPNGIQQFSAAGPEVADQEVLAVSWLYS